MADTNHILVYGLSLLLLQTILAFETVEMRQALTKMKETYWPDEKRKQQKQQRNGQDENVYY